MTDAPKQSSLNFLHSPHQFCVNKWAACQKRRFQQFSFHFKIQIKIKIKNKILDLLIQLSLICYQPSAKRKTKLKSSFCISANFCLILIEQTFKTIYLHPRLQQNRHRPSFQSIAIKLKFCHLKYFQIPTSDPSVTSQNDTTKTDDNLVGILKNGSTPNLTNGVDKINGDIETRELTPRDMANANVTVRRNSSTPSLRQFVNNASPLIEEESDEEEKDQNSSGENDYEALSENPVGKCSYYMYFTRSYPFRFPFQLVPTIVDLTSFLGILWLSPLDKWTLLQLSNSMFSFFGIL